MYTKATRLKLPGRGWTRAFHLAVPTKDIQMACSKSGSHSDFVNSQPFWEGHPTCFHVLMIPMSKSFGMCFRSSNALTFLFEVGMLSFSCLTSVNTCIALLVGS